MADQNVDGTSNDPGLYQQIAQLFGGSDATSLGQLLGPQAVTNAGRQSLLSAGAGLMSAAGPHPYRHSMGQDLAAGLTAGQQGYNSASEQATNAVKTRMALAMQAYQMQRAQALMRAIQAGPDGQGGGPNVSMGASGSPQAFQAPQIGGGGSPVGNPGMGSGAPPGGGQVAPGGRTSTVGMGAGGPGGLPQPPDPAAAATAYTSTGQIDGKVQNVSAKQARWYGNLAMLDPEHAAAYKDAYDMNNPELTTLPDGTVVNPHDLSQIGQIHSALPQGMVRGQGGQISNAPGYLNAQVAQTLADQGAKNYLTPLTTENADGSQTTVTQGGNLFGLTPGPNGPQISLGGIQSKTSPVNLAGQQQYMKNFTDEQSTAHTAALAAGNQAPALDNQEALLKQGAAGPGSELQEELLTKLGVVHALGDSGQQKLAALSSFANGQKQLALGQVKAALGNQRISNMEMQTVQKAFGDQNDPAKTLQMSIDLARVRNQRAQDYDQYLQNYNGDPRKFSQAWQQSQQGSKSLFDYPSMWKYGQIQRANPGSKAAQAGVVQVRLPNGKVVQAYTNQYGDPVSPVGG